jgi:hypothetical protein
MHPLIARFMSLPAAVSTLEKEEQESTVDSEESAFLRAAAALPKARAALLKAKGSKSPSPQVQQQLIIVATRAATLRVGDDPMLGPRVATAKAALEAEGATPAEADDLVAQAVLEEAFGYAEDPETFDGDFLAETLDSLSHLAKVTQEKLDDWLEQFARAGAAGDRALRLKVAELLLEAAWGDGPQPITPEHVDDALEQLGDTVAGSELERAARTLGELLVFLGQQHVLGAERMRRLGQVVTAAARAGGPEPVEGEPDEDDEA